jgi:tetratricopeptide (TPR) repeat protein
VTVVDLLGRDAEKQGATVPLMVGHRNMGASLFYAGDIVQSRAHYDRAIALYDPAEHRMLAARFSADVRVALLSYRSWALWLLGYPEAALSDAEHALKDARDTDQAATLMFAICFASWTLIVCGDYAKAHALLDETIALADEKGAVLWKADAMMRLAIRFDRQRPERSPNDCAGDCRVAIDGIDAVDPILFVAFGGRPCGTWPVRRRLALHRRSNDGD